MSLGNLSSVKLAADNLLVKLSRGFVALTLAEEDPSVIVEVEGVIECIKK